MAKFNVGDIAYIVESNKSIREVKIIRYSGGLYLIRFTEGGGIQIKEHRLFSTKEEAMSAMSQIMQNSLKRSSNPYDYEH